MTRAKNWSREGHRPYWTYRAERRNEARALAKRAEDGSPNPWNIRAWGALRWVRMKSGQLVRIWQ